MRERYIKFFENNKLQDFIDQNLGTGFAFKKKGSWGTIHWEVKDEQKGQKFWQKETLQWHPIETDREEEALIQYYNRYILKKL